MTLNSSEQAPSVSTNSDEGWAVHSRAPPRFSFLSSLPLSSLPYIRTPGTRGLALQN